MTIFLCRTNGQWTYWIDSSHSILLQGDQEEYFEPIFISIRIDSDTALNHDFFWTDPMPQSLEKMLSQHTQSMFEFLAPMRLGNAH